MALDKKVLDPQRTPLTPLTPLRTQATPFKKRREMKIFMSKTFYPLPGK